LVASGSVNQAIEVRPIIENKYCVKYQWILLTVLLSNIFASLSLAWYSCWRSVQL
jgi:hypothetical protein